jgi:hypothetical protein
MTVTYYWCDSLSGSLHHGLRSLPGQDVCVLELLTTTASVVEFSISNGRTLSPCKKTAKATKTSRNDLWGLVNLEISGEAPWEDKEATQVTSDRNSLSLSRKWHFI